MRTATVLLALLLPLAANADEKPSPVFELSATGDIEIGPQGKVYSYELDEGLSPPVEKLLAQSIAQWRFEPITVDGEPVIAATRMRIDLQALPAGNDEYRLRVEDVGFGEPDRGDRDMHPPRYPRDALRAGVGAKVVLVLKLDAQGDVQRVHTEQVSLSHESRRKSENRRLRLLFAEASAEAASDWSFEINVVLGGNPVGTSIRVPVTYNLGASAANDWHGYIPGERHPIPWPTGDALAGAGVAPLADGEVQSLGTRFELETDIVGEVL